MINNIFDDGTLEELLNKYNPEDKLGTAIKDTLVTNDDNFILPFIGTQGVGKSTLINSILKENILPNEADETTCIPVEIKYGEENKAILYHCDNSSAVINNSIEDLAQYVDNNYNKGNEKNISKIILIRNNPILAKGITLVDLPGVGSMTLANQKTTEEYLKKTSVAVFVISVVPTLLAKDIMFIKAAWTRFRKAIFVANNRENTKLEIEDSLDFNSKVLDKESKKIGKEFNNDIITVDAYNALVGALNNDEEKIKKSNIEELINKIKATAENWKESKNDDIKKTLTYCLEENIKYIEAEISKFNLTLDERRKQQEQVIETLKEERDKIRENVSKLNDNLIDKKNAYLDFLNEQLKICIGEIKNHIFLIIDKGVVDGPMLSQAFEDVQNEEVPRFFDAINDKSMEIQLEIEREFEELDLEMNKFDNFYPKNFYRKQQFKFEKGLKVLIELGGDVGAGLLGLTVGGPAGFAVAMGVALVSGIIGNLTKKGISNNRGNNAKKEITEVITQLQSELKETTTKEIKNYFITVENKLNSVEDSINQELKDSKKELSEISLDTCESDKKEKLEKDAHTFKSYLIQVKED